MANQSTEPDRELPRYFWQPALRGRLAVNVLAFGPTKESFARFTPFLSLPYGHGSVGLTVRYALSGSGKFSSLPRSNVLENFGPLEITVCDLKIQPRLIHRQGILPSKLGLMQHTGPRFRPGYGAREGFDRARLSFCSLFIEAEIMMSLMRCSKTLQRNATGAILRNC